MNEWIEGLARATKVFALVEVSYQQTQEGRKPLSLGENPVLDIVLAIAIP